MIMRSLPGKQHRKDCWLCFFKYIFQQIIRKKILWFLQEKPNEQMFVNKSLDIISIMTGKTVVLNSHGVEFIVSGQKRIKATLLSIELMGGRSLGEVCGQSFLGYVSA